MGAITAVTSVDNWRFQDSYVERLMDNAAYTAAHPESTLILAGPPRFEQISDMSTLLPIGMLQQFAVQVQKPTQMNLAIGSGRSFPTSGKSQIGVSFQRLAVNGRNLVRAIYTQAVQSGLRVDRMDEPPVSASADEQFYYDLDSELFYIPIGLLVLIRSKAHDPVMAFYIELFMFNSHQLQLAAGQNNVFEGASGIADRVRPVLPSSLTGAEKFGRPTSAQIFEAMSGQSPTTDLSR